ncbi:tRNA dihydrouridine synthase DusB [bacterium]|nr:MAG: tRNA dihydrouridine synthase DusB [bacterium]
MFRVGNVVVPNRLVLAPMEDVTSQPMRRIAKRIADPGLLFTEFVSAMALHYNATKSLRKMRVHADERPLAIQIFGGEPETMADAGRIAQDMGADIVDINMGCWVPKVCKTGAGAALMKDPEKAAQIVEAVAKAITVPLTVKVRAGWDYSLFAAPDLARRFQDAGAQMITLHARFAKQGLDGQADWDLIRRMRETVTVPLIGNGDVKTPEDALRMIDETGCDGVMVGRAAIANPWRLKDIGTALATGRIPEPTLPTLEERIATALEHARGMVAVEADVDSYEQAKGNGGAELVACRAVRGLVPIYIKGEPGAAPLRERLTKCSSIAEYEDVLYGFLNVRRNASLGEPSHEVGTSHRSLVAVGTGN